MFVAQLVLLRRRLVPVRGAGRAIYSLTRSAGLVALLLAAQTIPAAMLTFVGGPLADRLDRQRLMVVVDAVRGVLALGFFLIHTPHRSGSSTCWRAPSPASRRSSNRPRPPPCRTWSIPRIFRRGRPRPDPGRDAAVGAGLGGLVVATLGRRAGYVGDALSFFVSAALLIRIRRPFSEPREPHAEHPNLIDATKETMSYARRDHRVLALLAVKGGFGISTGVIGLLPVLAFAVYAAGDRGTGILYAFRGLGALIGPFVARMFIVEDDLRTLFWAISASLATYGVFYALVPWMPTIWLAALFVTLAHLGGGAQWTLSSYGLQRIVPDHIRGRVFAFDFGLVTASIAVAAILAGIAADHFDVRAVMLGFAFLGIGYSVLWTVLTRGVRRSLAPEPTDTRPRLRPV